MKTEQPPGWDLTGQCLTRQFEFESFSAAMAFMVECSYHCERLDHHPDWSNSYNKLSVSLTTHYKGAVTDKDHLLAEEFNFVYRRYSPQATIS